MRQWSFSVKYSTRLKNARDRSPKVKRSPHFNFMKQHRPQQDVNTGFSTSFHCSCAAYTDSHSRTWILDSQPVSIAVVQPTQTATGEPVAVIAKVQQPPRPSSASAQPTSYVVVDDQQPGTSRHAFQPTFSCTFTTGGKSAQHFWIIQSLLQRFPVCLRISRWTHHSHFHPLNLTSTVTSAIFHSSGTVKISQPVQPA